jgi:hypothetical protein
VRGERVTAEAARDCERVHTRDDQRHLERRQRRAIQAPAVLEPERDHHVRVLHQTDLRLPLRERVREPVELPGALQHVARLLHQLPAGGREHRPERSKTATPSASSRPCTV